MRIGRNSFKYLGILALVAFSWCKYPSHFDRMVLMLTPVSVGSGSQHAALPH